MPGVESVAIADSPPSWRLTELPYELAGAAARRLWRSRPTVAALKISPAYFRTLGATVLSGREFNDADGPSGLPVAIVNQRFASQVLAGRRPSGQTPSAFQ